MISFSSIPALDRHSAVVTGTVRALNRLFEVIDIVAVKGDYLAHIERFYNARLLRVPLVGDNTVELAESFRRAIRRQLDSDSYDVVHVRSPIEGTVVCEGQAERDYKIVYEAAVFSVQDMVSSELEGEELEDFRATIAADEVRCANAADLVIVRSETAHEVLKRLDVSTPIRVIPVGVNIDVYDWELSGERPIPMILCLGRLASHRDVSGVLEAIRRVQEVMPVTLRWIGEPDKERRALYMSLASEMGVEKAVSFEKSPEGGELSQILSSASICIAPTNTSERYLKWGDQPHNLLEYMACRTPVISARTPGVEEIVRDGTEAILYTPGDIHGLTSSILFLLRNKRHRDLLAKRGYRRVREQFSEASLRRSTTLAYAEVLGLEFEAAGKPARVPQPPEASYSGNREPITAVMETAEESRNVKIDGDTRRVHGEHENIDTQPHIQARDTSVDALEEDLSIPDTSPHKRSTEKLPSAPPPPTPVPPPETDEYDSLDVGDTSRIVSPKGEKTSD